MKRRRSVAGLCVLCALFISALAAQGASAAGTTAYTCKEEASAAFKYKDAHCKEESAGGNTGKFTHVAIPANTATEITLSNETTGGEAQPVKFKVTLGGVNIIEMTIAGISGIGVLSNEEEGGEMISRGEATITFTGITVTAPKERGCKAYTDVDSGLPIVDGEEGVVHTEYLKATTKEQGDSLTLSPAPSAGGVIARFVITGCTGSKSIEGLNGTYVLAGSVTCQAAGATCNFIHTKTTGQMQLSHGGLIPAGIEGSITLKGRANTGQGYTPLALTT